MQNGLDLAFERYSYRKDFDYLSYLETQSHFDRLQSNVDEGFRRLIVSNEELARDQIAVVSGLADTVSHGFETLALKLDDIKGAIDNVAWICNEGFARVSLDLNRLGSRIESIEKLTNNPSRVWAYEQFKVAKEAYLRNDFHEAMSSINLALNGHASNLGYRLDHRFYLLRGLIRLGNNRHFDDSIVNLKDAVDNFTAASERAASAALMLIASPTKPAGDETNDPATFIMYDPEEYKSDQARALGLAGWASYCQGDFANASQHLGKSLEINPTDLQSRYDFAKLLMHTDKVAEGREHLRSVLEADPKYAIRARSDSDFRKHDPALQSEIETLKDKCTEQIERHAETFKKVFPQSKRPILNKYSLDLTEDLTVFFEEWQNNQKSLSLSSLVSAYKGLPSKISTLVADLKSCANAVREKGDQTASSTVDKDYDDILFIPFAIAAWVVITLLTVTSHDTILEGIFIGVLGQIFILPISVWVAGPMIATVVTTIRKSSSKKANFSASEEIRRDAEALEVGLV
ncbi:MAG: tetratricopeptide repeat protein [Pseudomonadota bacterium]